MKNYTAIGTMSGTSLDGLDLVCARFSEESGKWTFRILATRVISYEAEWKQRLAGAPSFTGHELALLHVDFGKFTGMAVKEFAASLPEEPLLVASHGHTVFHRPEAGLSLQIGSGADIAAQSGLTTVCDFRSLDVALGGQGAPLVPAGDRLLFGDYEVCLNLGGFANFSFEKKDRRMASDICPANTVLNLLAQKPGRPFDVDGRTAAAGEIDDALLAQLNALAFYRQAAPKSLGREWLEKHFLPVLNHSSVSVPDLLRTVTEHIALQIADATAGIPTGSMLVTGGGAHNRFLISRIRALVKHRVVLPAPEIIDFKEALIFAFLGVLRYNGRPNCLSSATGAAYDNSGGAVYHV